MYHLRPYQKAAVDASLAHFRRTRSPAVIVLPTGAGKSLVIAELARIAKGRVLVLAHVKELVEQNHAKYESYGLKAGIYSAGVARKDQDEKVIFGSIQSVARAKESFFAGFSLLIIDECHRVGQEDDTQYGQVIVSLKRVNPEICILGLTATPYRLGFGWIYEYHRRGMLRSREERFFKTCIFELPLRYLIDQGFLTPPVKIDAPVACYDFSALRRSASAGKFAMNQLDDLLKDQARVTPGIVAHIIALAEDRAGVMIFTSSVRHAQEVMAHLPAGQAALVVGETGGKERDDITRRFKSRELKFLVNVSVLTTGFDAPHVDLIALLRPTESISLYQQIVGRGLRLSAGKNDCLILDYTGQGHDIFHPEIADDKPQPNSVPVRVECPKCGFQNDFWGLVDDDGQVFEHFGRLCQGASEDHATGLVSACGFRFRFKRCDRCGSENDVAARVCSTCQAVLVDNDQKLREAMALKDAHVMRPDSMALLRGRDKKGHERLEIHYYDHDGQALKEYFYLNGAEDARVFHYNFLRMHLRTPERLLAVQSIDDVLREQQRLRMPLFVIARKKSYFWQIREKIFE